MMTTIEIDYEEVINHVFKYTFSSLYINTVKDSFPGVLLIACLAKMHKIILSESFPIMLDEEKFYPVLLTVGKEDVKDIVSEEFYDKVHKNMPQQKICFLYDIEEKKCVITDYDENNLVPDYQAKWKGVSLLKISTD